MTGKKLDVVLAADIFEHVLSIKMAQRPISVGVLANQMRDFDRPGNFLPRAPSLLPRIFCSRCFSSPYCS